MYPSASNLELRSPNRREWRTGRSGGDQTRKIESLNWVLSERDGGRECRTTRWRRKARMALGWEQRIAIFSTFDNLAARPHKSGEVEISGKFRNWLKLKGLVLKQQITIGSIKYLDKAARTEFQWELMVFHQIYQITPNCLNYFAPKVRAISQYIFGMYRPCTRLKSCPSWRRESEGAKDVWEREREGSKRSQKWSRNVTPATSAAYSTPSDPPT